MLFSVNATFFPIIITKTSLSPHFKLNHHVPNHSLSFPLQLALAGYLPRSPLCATREHSAIRGGEEKAVNGRFSGAGDPSQKDVLPAGLRRELMPRHVAVIMDGNRRWALSRGLTVGCGYEAGARSLRVLVELCLRWGIKVLTVFAFSRDNWFRPTVEVEFLMSLLEKVLEEDAQSFLRYIIQILLN